MLSRLLDLVWITLVILLTPWLAWRRWVRRKSLGDWRQKILGAVPRRESNRPCLWLHAVSVGEVLQLPGIVAELGRIRPDLEIVVSTTTVTGFCVARKKLPEVGVVYWPLDFSWAVSAALDRIRPDLVALVELELWPNFLLAAGRRGVPVVQINGRITARSAGSYRWIGPVVRWMLGQLRWIAVQNPDCARRFIDLGAPPERVEVTGSVKFDGVETRRSNPKTEAYRQLLGLRDGDLVFVAGSTHPPEERLAIEAYLQAQREFPRLRLVLAPRHAERFDATADLIEQELGLPLLRRSTLGEPAVAVGYKASPLETHVILLDSLGELAACWGLADVAFVGGSLTNRGGQSMIEPAAYGAAVLFGPHTENFAEIVERLLHQDAAVVVPEGEQLGPALIAALRDPVASRERGNRAQQLIIDRQGATERTVQGLVDVYEMSLMPADFPDLERGRRAA